MEAKIIWLFTDGSVSSPTDGSSPGGWAFAYRLKDDRQIIGSGGCRMVTNNQMEMVAVIKGFQSLIANKLEGAQVIIVSDSQYVIRGASEWILQWKRNKWHNSRGKRIKNREYWKQIDYLAPLFNTRWKWVRGHNGHPDNEAVDKLARTAAFRAAGMYEASIQDG